MHLWRQSDVPEVCELTWILGSLTPMGLLERATSYKDKVSKGISPNFGLFAYPVLMAADILLYDTNKVPVGQDQRQHLEMTRDIAIKFNQSYGETFIVPEAEIRDEVAVVPGLDGQKMSKSYGNTIEIFGDEKVSPAGRCVPTRRDERVGSWHLEQADESGRRPGCACRIAAQWECATCR